MPNAKYNATKALWLNFSLIIVFSGLALVISLIVVGSIKNNVSLAVFSVLAPCLLLLPCRSFIYFIVGQSRLANTKIDVQKQKVVKQALVSSLIVSVMDFIVLGILVGTANGPYSGFGVLGFFVIWLVISLLIIMPLVDSIAGGKWGEYRSK